MKLLIIGGKGMAGHMIKDYFCERTEHEVWYTQREESSEEIKKAGGITLNVFDEASTAAILSKIKPDAVINAVGLLNNRADDRKLEAIYVNSLFPHKLAEHGRRLGFRTIHISTDCVFSGARGEYSETDIADGTTVYAKTKSLGEMVDNENVTIRTSIIGPELKSDGIGLFHWFMQQKGKVRGFRQVYWNGVTTLELAKVIDWILPRKMSGLLHLCVSQKISKYDLLERLKKVFAREEVELVPFDGIQSDKSLVCTRTDFTYPVSDYSAMLDEMKYWIDTRKHGEYGYD